MPSQDPGKISGTKYPADPELREAQGFSLRLSYSCSRHGTTTPALNACAPSRRSARLGKLRRRRRASCAYRQRPSSQQVRRLEQYLDTILFNHGAPALVLTEQGRDYLPELSRDSTCWENRPPACAPSAPMAC
jgi:hypothetical protein